MIDPVIVYAKIQNTSEIDKKCADKNTLSIIVVRLFNTFNLKSIIKSIGLEKPNGRSVCALLQNLILFRLYGESVFRSLVYGMKVLTSGYFDGITTIVTI